uniref:MTA1/2/3 n=1 Tax=Platynereis dumerilii TaxID=6359 RepID=A0A8E7IY27_PLADU|nr:MTA1/2/3 [Platynereis dumerilii]
MAANMYRVGDYVFFETSSSTPYQIRRIEELNKTPSGNVEAKVMCFYRRRDISGSLIQLADKHQSALEEEHEEQSSDELSDKQRHQLKHRELFLSRQVETLPATHIRGKCTVTLLNETESLLSYYNKEDAFFYSLVYDPQQKTLLADKGEIRVGSKYQAEVQRLLKEGETDGRNLKDLEELQWRPDHGHSDRTIDQFMVIARSVGTFARALDCTSTVRQPSLHMSAAAASRDVTLFHAMDTLHKHSYETAKAISSFVPPGGPVLCRDEMEEWSASEANLFEEALDKYGKDFNDIRQDFLPWKSLKSIVEYYYMWKTTDRYVQQKRIKAAEAETKLKQVYIPNYNKPNPAQITGKVNGADGSSGRACESCYSGHSNQWYAWGPVHMNCRLCAACWVYWKKYAGLKMPTRLGRLEDSSSMDDGDRPAPIQRQERVGQMQGLRMHRCTIGGCGKEFKLKAHLARHLATAHGLAIQAGSPRPVMKTRAAFCLITTPLTRISRQLCKDILRIRKAARQPFIHINIAAIKTECQARLPDGMKKMKELKPRDRKGMNEVVVRKGRPIDVDLPTILRRTDLGNKEPKKIFFPAPAEMPKPRVPQEDKSDSPAAPQPSIMKKRGYEQTNGVDGPAVKRPAMGVIRQAGSARQPGQMVRETVINHLNGRGGRTPMARSRKGGMSWIDAPDDVYFVATDATKKIRKQLTPQDFRRAARKPWRKLNVRTPGSSGEPDPIVIE